MGMDIDAGKVRNEFLLAMLFRVVEDQQELVSLPVAAVASGAHEDAQFQRHGRRDIDENVVGRCGGLSAQSSIEGEGL